LNTTTTYYIYDGEKPIVEYDANGTSVGVNVYGKGIDEILERVAIGTDNQWHSYFLQQNHEGSVTHLTDASGNVIEKYRYDAFGVPTIYDANWTVRSSTSYDNRFFFTGREYAATYRSTSTGLTFYEYRARAYNPTLGRFMSEDPKLFDAGDYNLFRYCHNDPIDLTDPMGLELDTSRLDAQQWNTTRAYLMQSPTYRNIITRAEGLPQKIVIVPNDKHQDLVAKRDPTTVYWDPHSALRTSDGGRQSPALGLGHEIDHAARRETDRKGYDRDRFSRDKEYGNREERRATQNESRAAKELGEDARSGHSADKGDRYHTASPTSRDPVNANAFHDQAIQKGTQKAAEDVSNAEHGLNPKPQ
jgi:RHS repeat-associated protein